MAGIPEHKSRVARILARTGTYDLVLAPAAVVSIAVAAYDMFYNHRPIRGILLVGAAVIVLVAGLRKAKLLLNDQSRQEEVHELEGCLHTLEGALKAFDQPTEEPMLRLTVHKPLDGDSELQQLLDYVGADRQRGQSAGRIVYATKGIIGLAMSTKLPQAFSRKSCDYELYVKELQQKWNFTENEARSLSPGSMSMMAIPLIEEIGSKRTVRAIVYLDAAIPDYFTDARGTVAINACDGIARFVKRRYKV